MNRTITTTSDLTSDLVTVITDDGCINQWTVLDSDGGRWFPSDEADEEIAASDDPGAAAIRICETEPMRGVWNS